jgi:hypothetical protein
VKTILAYWFLAALLTLGIGLPSAALPVSAAGSAKGHETDASNREETSENEAAARISRRTARGNRAGPALTVIGKTAETQRPAYSQHSSSLDLPIHRPRQQLQTVLRI